MENRVDLRSNLSIYEPRCQECGEFFSCCECPPLSPEALAALAEFPDPEDEEDDDSIPF